MPYKDLHDDPFNEGTISKLEIFEDYAQGWIPAFVMQGSMTICIFDFFAGTGYDKNGVPGSPIRILQKLQENIILIFQKKVKVKLFLNEFEPNKRDQKKFQLLQSACAEFLAENKEVGRGVEIIYHNENFETLFPKLLPTINDYPALVYLDQNGIKFLSDKYLLALEQTKLTDFLYFISSSYFWRFGDSKEFKDHMTIDMVAAKKDPYKRIHCSIIQQLKTKLPQGSPLKLYPFSIKKGANIHGIIFGASHPLAVDKFLSIAWLRNQTNGQANFDIDDDNAKKQLDFFEQKRLTKIEAFCHNFRSVVLAKKIKNNVEALQYAHDEGHIGTHAADCLKKMRKDGEINFEGISPLVTYENVYRYNKIIEYKLMKNETK